MTLPPDSRAIRSKRDLALEVAEGLLRDQGYLGVSMELVARGAGLRKPGLYHHFPGGKEEMMMVLAERLMARAEGGFRSAIAPRPTAIAQLGALAAWMFAEGRHTERMLRDVLRFVDAERQAKLYGHFERQLLAQVRAVLDAGVDSGELRVHNTELSMWAFMGLLSEFAVIEPPTGVNLAEWLLDFFAQGVLAQTSPA
ncbi:TetR/AcrR family transcriptional regulator [Deinococcus sp.]|uniref:TetR/AcrR family transcriptional regulator n=1 Tax=Deinococcus sp. TaxID=47478 RepID=UPI003CC6439D